MSDSSRPRVVIFKKELPEAERLWGLLQRKGEIYSDQFATPESPSKAIGRQAWAAPAFRSAFAEYDDQEVRRLEALDEVEQVVDSRTYSIASDGFATPADSGQIYSRALRDIGAAAVWEAGFRGRAIKVAVLDTGADDHPDLPIAGGVSMVPDEPWDDFRDDHGHGTHCAGLLAARHGGLDPRVMGVAPECELHIVRVLRKRPRGLPSGETDWLAGGLLWAGLNNMDVVCMSLSSAADRADEPPDPELQIVTDWLTSRGCLVLSAVGNHGRTSAPWVGHPARCPDVVGVGSVTASGRVVASSARGPQSLSRNQSVELTAPGMQALSTWPGDRSWFESGTSVACALTAGVAVLVKQKFPDRSPAWIRQRLLESADDIAPSGFDTPSGFGVVNCRRAVLGASAQTGNS